MATDHGHGYRRLFGIVGVTFNQGVQEKYSRCQSILAQHDFREHQLEKAPGLQVMELIHNFANDQALFEVFDQFLQAFHRTRTALIGKKGPTGSFDQGFEGTSQSRGLFTVKIIFAQDKIRQGLKASRGVLLRIQQTTETE